MDELKIFYRMDFLYTIMYEKSVNLPHFKNDLTIINIILNMFVLPNVMFVVFFYHFITHKLKIYG